VPPFFEGPLGEAGGATRGYIRYNAIMKTNTTTQDLFRSLPKVDEVLLSEQVAALPPAVPRTVVLASARTAIENMRSAIATGSRTEPVTLAEVVAHTVSGAHSRMQPSLRRVINATGIIIHTNLGRSVLADSATEAVQEAASHYSTLEYNCEKGVRGSRHDHVESLLCELTGAEAALAVNNNAAAVMMCIACFARGSEAIVSRGQLVEIGGSFRVPDIMAESGAHMVEVGTTNKTHLKDYENATGEKTGLYLKVHSSNYRVVGFTSEVELSDLVELGARQGIPVMEDQGSGVLIDLRKYGLPYEPTVSESVKAGASIVTFSGDKLLGGPQAGIIVGKSEAIAQLKAHPLARVLRLDKMTLAALEATLMIYRDEDRAVAEIPTLRALTMDLEECKKRANGLAEALLEVLRKEDLLGTVDVSVKVDVARAGGGSLPLADIPTAVLSLAFEDISATEVERLLRIDSPVPIVARINDERLLIDPRTFVADDAAVVVEQLCKILRR